MAEKCLSFDGVDDYVNCGSDSSLKPQRLTLEFWAKTDDYTASLNGGVGYGAVFGVPASRAYLVTFHNGNCGLGISDGTDGYGCAVSIGDNDWHYWALTYDGSNVRAYKDASEVDGSPVAASIVIAYPSYYFMIGARSNGDYSFTGKIDEIRVSDKARTQAEISAIWNNGNGVQFEVDANTVALWHMNEGSAGTIYDETNNDNDGTITGASWTDGYDFLTSRPTSSDAGSGIDAGTLSEAFFSADSGVGLGALAALLAVINTSEVSSGSDRLRAKIESATAGGDMKLPPGGQASIPSRKVGI